MSDRRLLTDVGLALLIALPLALPAAPSAWTATDQTERPSAQPERPSAFHRGGLDFAYVPQMGQRGYGRS